MLLKTFTFLILICCSSTLYAQTIVDSLVIDSVREAQLVYYQQGKLYRFFPDYIQGLAFRDRKIIQVEEKHHFQMEVHDGEKFGINRSYVQQPYFHGSGQESKLSFQNYQVNGGGYQMNLLSIKDDFTSTLNAHQEDFAYPSKAYYWNDKVAYFKSGTKNTPVVIDLKSKKVVLQTPPNSYVTYPSTQSKSAGAGDRYAYIIKQHKKIPNNLLLICMTNLRDLTIDFKEINLPKFTTGGGFRNMMIDGDLIYLVFCGSELPSNDPEFYGSENYYLIEIDFKTEAVRSVNLSDLFEKVDIKNQQMRFLNVQLEEKDVYVSMSWRDYVAEDSIKSKLPLEQKLLRINRKDLTGKKILDYRSFWPETVYPYGDYFLTYHKSYNRKTFKVDKEVFYLRQFIEE